MSIDMPIKANGMNDWVEYRKLVLKTLDDLKVEQKEIRKDQGKIKETQVQIRLDVRELKVRAALWGAAAGLITSGIFGLILARVADII